MEEIAARQKYLYDIFNVYVIVKCQHDGFIHLESFPSHIHDFFIIIGHNSEVQIYLMKNLQSIPERNLIVVSCLINERFLRSLPFENVFLAKERDNDSRVYFYDGTDYGFPFEITDSELDLYNSNGDTQSRIEISFNQLL